MRKNNKKKKVLRTSWYNILEIYQWCVGEWRFLLRLGVVSSSRSVERGAMCSDLFVDTTYY